MKNVGNSKKGFTIIEVVLVLAIAGLIFLIVFLAVPALQRNRRDTQRRNDVGRMMSQLEQYASNNNGAYPTSGQVNDFIGDYMDDFNDPTTGEEYNVAFGAAEPDGEGDISYNTDAVCDGSDIDDGDGDRNVAVAVFLESGGAYCQDNK